MSDILDALDYPDELEPIYRAYHDARHEWEATRAAYLTVVCDYCARTDGAANAFTTTPGAFRVRSDAR